MAKKKITGGLYLVVNPESDTPSDLIKKIQKALDGGIDLIQLLNSWPDQSTKLSFIHTVCCKAETYGVPVIINQDMALLERSNAQGIHFDNIPDTDQQTLNKLLRNYYVGLTCTNDLNLVKWADEHKLDYISFCSMFPSSSVSSCEIIKPETVKQARNLTNIPLFLAGGIQHDNIDKLAQFNSQGVAIISGIMDSSDIKKSTEKFKQKITLHNTYEKPYNQ